MTIDMTVFDPWLKRWDLTPDGPPIAGTWASLLPVRRGGEPAMLKAGMTPEEKTALDLLAWAGAAPVLLLVAAHSIAGRTGEQRCPVAVGIGVDHVDGLLEIVDPEHRQHRPEDLVPVDLHRRRHPVQRPAQVGWHLDGHPPLVLTQVGGVRQRDPDPP